MPLIVTYCKNQTNIPAQPDWYVAHLQLNKICSIIMGQMYFGLLHEEILLMNTSAEHCIQPKQDVQIVL